MKTSRNLLFNPAIAHTFMTGAPEKSGLMAVEINQYLDDKLLPRSLALASEHFPIISRENAAAPNVLLSLAARSRGGSAKNSGKRKRTKGKIHARRKNQIVAQSAIKFPLPSLFLSRCHSSTASFTSTIFRTHLSFSSSSSGRYRH